MENERINPNSPLYHTTRPVTETRAAAFRRISWGAVIAGTVVALVVQMTLNLLGIGIGLGTIDPAQEANPLSGLGTGAIIWYVLSTLIALFLGGWVAGRLAGIPRAFDSVLHGTLTWCLFTIISAYLLTSAIGGIVSGVGNLLGTTISTAGKGIAAIASNNNSGSNDVDSDRSESSFDVSSIKQEVRDVLRETGQPALQPENLEKTADSAAQIAKSGAAQIAQNPQQAEQIINRTIDKIFAQGNEAVSAADRDAAVNSIVANTGKSRAEAEQMVDNWINTFQQAKADVKQTAAQAKQQARQTAGDISDAVSKAAIYAFIGLVLGAIAASFGGKVGEPHDLAAETVHDTPITR